MDGTAVWVEKKSAAFGGVKSQSVCAQTERKAALICSEANVVNAALQFHYGLQREACVQRLHEI